MSNVRSRVIDREGHERSGQVLGIEVKPDSVELLVLFKNGEDVSMPTGFPCELELFGPELYSPHSFQGTPVRRWTNGGGETYGFLVDSARRFELEMVVGGQESLRVTPAPGQVVTVDLIDEASGLTVSCPLIDASVVGLAVEVDWGAEGQLVAMRDISLKVFLPGVSEEPELMRGSIRRRTMKGDRITYGIALDANLDPRYNRTMRELCAWVEDRYAVLSGGAKVMRRAA